MTFPNARPRQADLARVRWCLTRVGGCAEARSFSLVAFEHLRAQTPGRGDWIGVLDGEQVGVGTCSLPIGMEASAVAWSMLFVLREARHQAVGGSLYRRVSEHPRTLGRSELHMYSFEDDADTAGFGERHGFRVVARVRGLRLPLERCPRPQVDAPACEAFPDMPSPDDAPVQAGSYEQFVAAELSRPRHIPQATFVAVADGQVVGDSQLGWLRRSAGIADGAMIAVRRGWRGPRTGAGAQGRTDRLGDRQRAQRTPLRK